MVAVRPASSAARKGSAGEDAFAKAHRELLSDRTIQFEMTPAPPPDMSQVRRDVPIRTQTLPSAPAEPGPIPHFLFWIIIGIAAAGLLYLIVSRLSGWQRGERKVRSAAPEWQMDEEPARALLGDADRLAAEGRYSEAAHLLLHRSIDEIDQRRPASVRKALTSRDIARLPEIPPSPAAAFASIVRAVERSLFGGRPLEAGDWRQCREAYERFAFAREWQA